MNHGSHGDRFRGTSDKGTTSQGDRFRGLEPRDLSP